MDEIYTYMLYIKACSEVSLTNIIIIIALYMGTEGIFPAPVVPALRGMTHPSQEMWRKKNPV